MNTKRNTNFSIWGPKNATTKKTAENICYTYISLWTTIKFSFRDQFFIKKKQGDLFS